MFRCSPHRHLPSTPSGQPNIQTLIRGHARCYHAKTIATEVYPHEPCITMSTGVCSRNISWLLVSRVVMSTATREALKKKTSKKRRPSSVCVRYAFTVSCCRSTHIDRPLTICAGVLLLHLPPGAYPVSTVPDLRRCPHLQITHTIDNLYLAHLEDHNFARDKCRRRHGWHGTLHLGFVGI